MEYHYDDQETKCAPLSYWLLGNSVGLYIKLFAGISSVEVWSPLREAQLRHPHSFIVQTPAAAAARRHVINHAHFRSDPTSRIVRLVQASGLQPPVGLLENAGRLEAIQRGEEGRGGEKSGYNAVVITHQCWRYRCLGHISGSQQQHPMPHVPWSVPQRTAQGTWTSQIQQTLVVVFVMHWLVCTLSQAVTASVPLQAAGS